MFLRIVTCLVAPVILVFPLAITQGQKQTSPKQTTTPSSTPKPEEQDRIKIFTEEVVLPIVAYDAYGHFDPSIGLDDVLVLENGISQRVPQWQTPSHLTEPI
ncbi:MAG TPA: hypothetical protein VJ875_19025 [Pyrinomonadaceae bacterium]|nr:hypothetical protein [Pyrinomonadaceae bacterium]